MKIIIATIKSWNVKNADKFRIDNYYEHDVFIITNKDDLTYEKVSRINPEYIFLPHWSWIIPKKIYETFNCIVFHMTDLPFGRGGSLLQNLIERGIENTKISAIKVDDGIDTGDIYFKESLNLNGTADEIFIRASEIIFKKMIPRIISEKIIPETQKGEIVQFKRRNPLESEIFSNFHLEKIYDYIRMLDAEGYPGAFIKFGKYKLEFSRASLKNNKIIADVEIIDEDD
ncbi:formyltransferase family protein [Clostridium sporogenes]|uniref:formyltransferase family protein n=1 Tax=Clostridium sporogenes TaxID=1509 RepID=UPI0013D4B6B8|nr:formyltransferase family protein [Clostridium sporogenes]MBA4509861.1 methionyl-tRNA formyltransferase [Clostridium sporogenes]MCW6090226.1 methionyl-tRNA formyltransferase [Clostridium sporogenes]MCW6122906.1 methionyl-tRNA formyltransferase [Clostridium sporogenes]MDU6337215.1 formyltransferase family protein [Clostridium sporogenes]NFD95090.1 methionyl-tRNA formyltransferase [Clostridium sporogenes]